MPPDRHGGDPAGAAIGVVGRRPEDCPTPLHGMIFNDSERSHIKTSALQAAEAGRFKRL
jgi:hypothetical protein